MDFHALMKKKLGGKYDQPKFTDDNRAREDTVADDKGEFRVTLSAKF